MFHGESGSKKRVKKVMCVQSALEGGLMKQEKTDGMIKTPILLSTNARLTLHTFVTSLIIPKQRRPRRYEMAIASFSETSHRPLIVFLISLNEHSLSLLTCIFRSQVDWFDLFRPFSGRVHSVTKMIPSMFEGRARELRKPRMTKNNKLCK